VADGYSKYQGHDEQGQSIRNTRQEDRYQENIRRTDSHQRETNGTDENLFQYSATNDRLHEDDRMNSYDREDGYDIQEYMSSQQGRSGQSYQREVYNKIRSDIMYSKERNDVVDSRISAFETANKLLKSKIIGHLTHHQGKVEQIPDISKRVPQSTLAQSRAVDDRTLYRPPENTSQQAARGRGEPLKSRSRGWESQQPQYGGFQKYVHIYLALHHHFQRSNIISQDHLPARHMVEQLGMISGSMQAMRETE
jgi:hypothetical protein